MFHHQPVPYATQLPAGAFLVRRKLASIESYRVFDAGDRQVYRFTNRLSFPAAGWMMLDAGDTQVAGLVWAAMGVQPTFTLLRSGRPDVVIRKASFAPLQEIWRLEGAEGGDIELTGNVFDHEFAFVAGDGRTVGTASRPWASITDSFSVRAPGLDQVLAIATAVAIDSVERAHKG